MVSKSLAKEVVTLHNNIICSTQQKKLQMKDDKLKNLEQQYMLHNVCRRLQMKDNYNDRETKGAN